MPRRVRCRMCGELTTRPREVYATPAIAPGVDAPGARTEAWQVCPSCASLLDDDDNESPDAVDETADDLWDEDDE